MRITWTTTFALALAIAAPAAAQEPAPPQAPPSVRPEVAVTPEEPAPQDTAAPQNKPKATPGANSSSTGSSGRMANPHEMRRERRKAWIFNRYAGSVEMQDKTPYPYGYYGDYYYRGWKPTWVYPLPPPPLRFEEPPVIRHPEGMPNLEQPEDQPPAPAARARTKTKRG